MQLGPVSESPAVPVLHFTPHDSLVLLRVEDRIHAFGLALRSKVSHNVLKHQVAGRNLLFQQKFLAP